MKVTNKEFFFFFIIISVSFIFNYINYVLLSNLLSPKNFSIFYTVVVLSNILITPCIVYNFHSTKMMINTSVLDKRIFIQQNFTNLNFLSLIYFLILQLFYIIVNNYYNLNYILYFVVTLIVFLQCYIEYLRLILEIDKKIIKSSSYTFFFNLLKLIFCTGIAFFYLKVWIVALGFVFSQILVILHYYYNNFLRLNFKNINLKKHINREFFLFLIFFILMISFVYLDIILSYFILVNDFDFVNYSSSNILPKSILMFLLPFIKAIYPNLHNKDYYDKTINIFFLIICFISFTILTCAYVSNFIIPSILRIKNVNQLLLLYSSWATFFGILCIFLILYNLANRNYKKLSLGFSLSILFLFIPLINKNLSAYSYGVSFLKFYLSCFFIFLIITVVKPYKKI